jgi:DNA-binding MurR/RpiR family transcriptional regulator
MADLSSRLRAAAERLTAAERKVADVVAGDPQVVAFGTVAELASATGTSGATVVRLAAKLGFEGYSALQEAVQGELGRRLRPAAENIRTRSGAKDAAGALAASVDRLNAAIEHNEAAALDAVVERLAARKTPVWVVAGDASSGVVSQFATELGMLRPDVRRITGSPVAVARQVAEVSEGDTFVAVDVARYDRWLLDALDLARDRGAVVVAVTDGPLSPLARDAEAVLIVDADGVGPFDDYVGVLALLGALVTGAAAHLRTSATDSLDRIEHAWRQTEALAQEP